MKRPTPIIADPAFVEDINVLLALQKRDEEWNAYLEWWCIYRMPVILETLLNDEEAPIPQSIQVSIKASLLGGGDG